LVHRGGGTGRDGLFDRRVLKFRRQIPESVPSGLPLQRFEGCE